MFIKLYCLCRCCRGLRDGRARLCSTVEESAQDVNKIRMVGEELCPRPAVALVPCGFQSLNNFWQTLFVTNCHCFVPSERSVGESGRSRSLTRSERMGVGKCN